MSSTSLIKVNFASIALNVATVYEVPIIMVNFGVISYFICYVIFAIPSIKMLDRGKDIGSGVNCALKMASIIEIIGVWGRVFTLETTDNLGMMMVF